MGGRGGKTSSLENGYYNEHDEFYLKHPFAIVLRFAGTVWPLVLPYCALNCAILTGLTLLDHFLDVRLSILPEGHALMAVLISYLGVSKVNLAYGRYIDAQVAVGHAFMTLRELHQLALTLTAGCAGAEADEWRSDARRTIVQLIHETVATLRDGRHAAMLARNVFGVVGSRRPPGAGGSDDPMTLVHALRLHMYRGGLALTKEEEEHGTRELQLLERSKMIDLLHEFTVSYRNLLRLASTPMPFALVQMGRTFTILWTLTMPFVLTGPDFVEDYASAFAFVILLTYGFLGLEFVSRMLSNPFGDEIRNDLNIVGMGTAAVIGIENDARQHEDGVGPLMKIDGGDGGTPRSRSAGGGLRRLVKVRQDSIRGSGRFVVLNGGLGAAPADSKDVSCDMPYSAMGEGSVSNLSVIA